MPGVPNGSCCQLRPQVAIRDWGPRRSARRDVPRQSGRPWQVSQGRSGPPSGTRPRRSTCPLIAFAMVFSLTPRRRPIAELLSRSWWRARGIGGEPAGPVGLHRPPPPDPEPDFLDETRPERQARPWLRGASCVSSMPNFHLTIPRRQQNARRLLSGRLPRENRKRFANYPQDSPVEGLASLPPPMSWAVSAPAPAIFTHRLPDFYTI